MVPVPAGEAEDQRPLPRALAPLKQERASTTPRIKGVLRSQGRRLTSLRQVPEQLEALRLWEGSPLPSGLRRRGLRGWAPHAVLRHQIAEVAAARRALLASAQAASLEQVRQWMHLQGSGINGAWG